MNFSLLYIQQAFMVGIVFAKMARPKQRCQTLMFSRNAVICRRDGQLCFMFRVGDVREKSHLIGTTIRTRFIRSRVTPEGETLSPNVTHLEVRRTNNCVLFIIYVLLPLDPDRRQDCFGHRAYENVQIFRIHIGLSMISILISLCMCRFLV